jgi:hypothetical protein
MNIAIMCEHMKWTFQEYASQPLWLIDALRIKMKEDNKEANKKA